jgi:hypothetical protein
VILARNKVQTLFTLFNLIFNAKSRVSVDPSGVRGSRSSELRDSGMLGKIERKRKMVEGRTYFPISQCYNKRVELIILYDDIINYKGTI